MADSKMLKSLTFLQLVVSLMLSIGAPAISGLLAYNTAIGDTKTEFIRIRLENEQGFVKKADFKEIADVLHTIDTRLSIIESRTRR